MSELSMMVTITERSKLTAFLSFYRERQVPVQFISLPLSGYRAAFSVSLQRVRSACRRFLSMA